MSNGSRLKSEACVMKPKLTFSYLAWSKIWKLTENNKQYNKYFECTCFGIMDPKDPSRCINVWVPKQTNTPAHTDADDEDRAAWAAELIADGINLGQVALWHHSHANMGVFWSGEDLDTIKKYAADNIQWSVVTNVRGEMKVRADLFHPVRFWWDDCDFEVEYPELNLDSWWEGVKPKLTNNKPVQRKLNRPPKKNKASKGTAKALPSPEKALSNMAYHDDSGEVLVDFSGELPWNLPRDYSTLPLDDYLRTNGRPHHKYMTFSHPLIQAAFDEDYVTPKEAERLDLEFVTGEKSEEDLGKAIAFMVKHHLSETHTKDEVEDVIRFLKSPASEWAHTP